jgi:hypothetical protein
VAKKRIRALSVDDVRSRNWTLEELRAVSCTVLGSPAASPDYRELLDLASLYLETFGRAQIPVRDRKWMASAAGHIGLALMLICRQWREGDVRHLEEAFGWERPKNWLSGDN